jgi:hypothetical protein
MDDTEPRKGHGSPASLTMKQDVHIRRRHHTRSQTNARHCCALAETPEFKDQKLELLDG